MAALTVGRAEAPAQRFAAGALRGFNAEAIWEPDPAQRLGAGLWWWRDAAGSRGAVQWWWQHRHR
jgi:hypothetical protein